MVNVTLNYLISLINNWADTKSIIQEHGTGFAFKIDTKQNRKYPLIWITPQPGYVKDTSQVYVLDLMFADLIDGEEANLQDCWNDMLEIAKDFVRYFSTNYGYFTSAESNDYDVRLNTENIYYEPFAHLLDNETAGVFLRAEFIVPFSHNWCLNPTK